MLVYIFTTVSRNLVHPLFVLNYTNDMLKLVILGIHFDLWDHFMMSQVDLCVYA